MKNHDAGADSGTTTVDVMQSRENATRHPQNYPKSFDPSECLQTHRQRHDKSKQRICTAGQYDGSGNRRSVLETGIETVVRKEVNGADLGTRNDVESPQGMFLGIIVEIERIGMANLGFSVSSAGEIPFDWQEYAQ